MEKQCDCTVSSNINGTIKSFNYPDCKYLSKLYDLTLQSDVNIENNTNWFSISSITSNKPFILTSTNTIHVQQFTITNSYNLIIKQDMMIDSIIIKSRNEKIFLQSFSYNNFTDTLNGGSGIVFNGITSDKNKLKNNGYYVYCDIEIYKGEQSNECICKYNNGFEHFSCTFGISTGYHLHIQSDYNSISTSKWLSIITGTKEIKLTSSLSSTLCYFNNSKIIINGNITCDTMIINNNTEITLIEGKINIQQMIIENNNKEYNNNGTIRIINGDITIKQITINNEIETCNELISFKNNNNFHLPSIYYKNNHNNKYFNGIMINNNKLYRMNYNMN